MSALDVSIELIMRRIFARLRVRFHEWAALRRMDANAAGHATLRLEFNMQASTYLEVAALCEILAKASLSAGESRIVDAFIAGVDSRHAHLGRLEGALRSFIGFCEYSEQRRPQVMVIHAIPSALDAQVTGFSEARELVRALLRPPPSASLDELVQKMSVELRNTSPFCGHPECIAPTLRKKPVSSGIVRSRHPAAVATNDELWAAYAREGLGEDEIYGLASMASSRGGASCRS